jgi:hypothetical protein
MATLIPALGACVSRMTSGEKRLAQRLEDKLDSDYLLWYDVPVGPTHSHPDFVVMHPRRGLLVLEVKDWKPATIQQADKQTWTIIPDGTPKTVINPLEQARQYAHQVVDALKRDPQLTQPDGPHQGQVAFPWSYGVVLTHITRKQFKRPNCSTPLNRTASSARTKCWSLQTPKTCKAACGACSPT